MNLPVSGAWHKRQVVLVIFTIGLFRRRLKDTGGGPLFRYGSPSCRGQQVLQGCPNWKRGRMLGQPHAHSIILGMFLEVLRLAQTW